MEKLLVIFRVGRSKKDAGYGVTAVFPSFEEGPSMAMCYAHVGQHSACSHAWYRTTRFATTEEANSKSCTGGRGDASPWPSRWPWMSAKQWLWSINRG
jgi:hypothetical protein